MSKRYLGVDIGGTAVKLGLVDEAGTVLATGETSVNFDGYQTPILDTVLATVDQFLAQEGEDPAALAGVGVSATGQVDSRQGVVAGTCGSLPGWAGAPVGPALAGLLGLPVAVANDANCMVLGEAWVGAARGCTDVVGVTIGTGLGGGILTGGRLLEGSRGLAGELGHMPLHAGSGAVCTCGNTGCWERCASTSALVRAAAKAGLPYPDGRAIFAAVQGGDARAAALVDGWLDEVAAGLVGLVHLFNPQLILIGGGVSAQQQLVIAPLAEKVRAAAMPAFAQGLALRAAALHNQAGLVGAVKYFIDTHQG